VRHAARDVLDEALKTTLSFWSGWQKAILALALVALGVVNLWLHLDAAHFRDQLNALLLYTFEPLTLFACAQFLFNLARAPYRLECSAHEVAIAQIHSLEERMASLGKQLEEQSPVSVDPTTGATVIGKAQGPVTIIGGHFSSGLRVGS